MKEQNTNLPYYLKDLAKPTAIGREKLIALWDGLTLENQIILLTLIKDDYEPPVYQLLNRLKRGEPSGELPSTHSLNYKLLLKALGSKNDFIRYLAANQLYDFSLEEADTEQVNINNQIDNDKSDLVKYTKHLEAFTIPDDFFELPLKARLAVASLQRKFNFSLLNDVIKEANDKGLFKSEESETELNQVLWELVNNSEIWKEYPGRTINTELLLGKDELWSSVPNLPLSSGSILVEKMPIDSGSIPEGLFYKLTRIQQNILFEREDFVMSEIRREFYFKDADENGDNFWHTAPGYHLTISDEDFSEILNTPNEERASRLRWLTTASDLSLHHHLMLRFLVKYDDEQDYRKELKERHAELVEKKLVDYYNELKREDNLEFIDENLYKHRLVSLAWRASHWDKESFDTALHFRNNFFNIRVEKDIWATYLAFYKDIIYDEITYKDLPIGAFESEEDIPKILRNPKPIEPPFKALDNKFDQILDLIKERAYLIIVVLALLIFWDR